MTKDLTDQFAQVGIYIDDTTTAYEKLVLMAEAYNANPFTVDEDTGEALGDLTADATDLFNLFQDVSGTYNINTLVSGFSNFDTVLDVVGTTAESSGSALEEYATALDSIDAKLIRHSIVEILYIQQIKLTGNP